MKTRILLVALVLLNLTISNAQNTKHSITSGKIVFDVTYPESQMDEKTMANFPTESIMYFKGDMVKVEVAMPMGKTTIISNNKSGDGTMLMDMMGQKYAIKTNKEELQKQKEAMGATKVALTRETKMIAGYSCKKAVITVTTKGGDKSIDAWFTNELKARNSFSSQIEGIDGFLMEFENSQNGMSMKMTARSVEPKDIDDSEFAIPDGYEVKTMEELKKGYGK